MAHQSIHLASSISLGLVYTTVGYVFFEYPLEIIALALLLFMIGGFLPNIDSTDGAKNSAGILAIIAPFTIFELYPEFKDSGISTMLLMGLSSFIIVRKIIFLLLANFTYRRGMYHSIPFALIATCATYVMLWDLPQGQRIYVSLGLGIALSTHLFLDVLSANDSGGSSTIKKFSRLGPLKLMGHSMLVNVIFYLFLLILGVQVLSDFFPKISKFRETVIKGVTSFLQDYDEKPKTSKPKDQAN